MGVESAAADFGGAVIVEACVEIDFLCRVLSEGLVLGVVRAANALLDGDGEVVFVAGVEDDVVFAGGFNLVVMVVSVYNGFGRCVQFNFCAVLVLKFRLVFGCGVGCGIYNYELIAGGEILAVASPNIAVVGHG